MTPDWAQLHAAEAAAQAALIAYWTDPSEALLRAYERLDAEVERLMGEDE